MTNSGKTFCKCGYSVGLSAMRPSTFYIIPLALAVYYFCMWLLAVRRPGRESIVVRYRPPAGLSPAAVRYIATLGCDGRTFVAILAQLAAYKLLSITSDPERGAAYLSKLQEDRHILMQLPDEERIVLKEIFEWQDQTELGLPEFRLMQKIQESLQKQLTKYVTRNLPYVVAAILMSGAATAWMCLSLHLFGDDRFEATLVSCFTGLTVAMFAAAAVYLWDSNFQAIKLAFRGLYHRRALLFLFFLILLFPAMWYLLMRTVAPTFANVTGLLILINMLAAPLLRNHTSAGRQLFNEICGFRQFLQRAEQDRLQRLNPADQPMQADQEYIPYAIALDVREDWGDQLGIKTMVETAL
jgi:hypothetical protein